MWYVITLLLFRTILCSDSFHEELLLKSLEKEKVYTHFQFTTLWSQSLKSNQFDHCHLFPHSLAEIIQQHGVQEFHVTLTGGLWRHRYWGYPIIEAPAGAELWVWFRKDVKDVDKNWKGLTSALSGLLCASFNFIDNTNSVSPKISFRPLGVVDEELTNSSHLRYASMPREIVCTENLTPWKKLLPCDSVRGLASLLNARNIHSNINYHSIGLHYRPVCANTDCTSTSIELKQTVSLVYDLVLFGGNINEWSFRKLFGIGLFNHCPLAKTSNIYIDITNDAVELSKTPDEIVTSIKEGSVAKYAVFDVSKVQQSAIQNLVVKHSGDFRMKSSLLYAHRYIKGYGKEVGGIITKIINNHKESVPVVYFENIPWFVPLYYHTLTIKTNTKTIVPWKKHYIPGKIRSRSSYLEVAFEIPARSVVEISIDFDYTFLKWQEYPPDANHGFYVGSAVITAILPQARNFYSLPREISLIKESFNATHSEGFIVYLRTESFILGLPTPDFSMPYNVICLSCTVVALAFGPIHNITTKRLKLSKNPNKSKLRSFISSLFRLVSKAKTD